MKLVDLSTATADEVKSMLDYESARAWSLTSVTVLGTRSAKAKARREIKKCNANVNLLMDALGYTADGPGLSDEDLLAALED